MWFTSCSQMFESNCKPFGGAKVACARLSIFNPKPHDIVIACEVYVALISGRSCRCTSALKPYEVGRESKALIRLHTLNHDADVSRIH